MALDDADLLDALIRHASSDALVAQPVGSIELSPVGDFDPTNPRELATGKVQVTPSVNPIFAAAMQQAGATRRGRFTWTTSLSEDVDYAPVLREIAKVLPDNTVYPLGALVDGRGKLVNIKTTARGRNSYTMWNGYRGVVDDAKTKVYSIFQSKTPNMLQGHMAFGLEIKRGQLWIRAYTYFGELPHTLNLNVDLDTNTPVLKQTRQLPPMRAADVVALIGWADSRGIPVYEPDGTGAFVQLMRTARSNLVAWPARGKPGVAALAIGTDITDAVDVDGRSIGSSKQPVQLGEAPIGTLRERVDALDPSQVHMDEQVADTLSILSAEPTEIEMCRGYQNEFIGQYVSTNFGLVNACEPGLGKTVMALKSAELLAQRKAEEGDDGRYRMLVLVNASLRTQWARESERFADGFEVITVRSKRDADDLQAALDDDESTEPLIVVCSYSLARRVITTLDDHEGDVDPIGQALASVHWDDVVPDEAQGLRTTGSQLYRAMWMLRERTRRGLPLTGTPMSKGVDDLGRLISWARSEPDMFHGVRLSQQFDLTTEAGRDAFLEAVGPVMFRRDKSEISDELPNLDTQVVFLDPSFDEAQLARKAKDGLKEEYTELVDTIAELERLNPDDERFAQMRERLTMAKDAVRTSRSVARKAASDPVALINSEQTAAKLLAGYINKAAEKPGTKRIWCVDYVEDLVDDGEQVVIFTEYPAVADALVADLEERDIAVGKVAGSGGRTRDRHVTEFQEGVRRVVVCTKAGEQGLNLQNASTLINYDVPWLPDRILQRLGRIERIGATSEKLKVVFPIMAETIEERVAAIVVARVSAQLQALDASRGIDLNDTSTGKTFANLAHSVNLDELDDDNAKLVEITRLVLDETVSTDEYDEVDERMDAEIAAAEEAVPA